MWNFKITRSFEILYQINEQLLCIFIGHLLKLLEIFQLCILLFSWNFAIIKKNFHDLRITWHYFVRNSNFGQIVHSIRPIIQDSPRISEQRNFIFFQLFIILNNNNASRTTLNILFIFMIVFLITDNYYKLFTTMQLILDIIWLTI